MIPPARTAPLPECKKPFIDTKLEYQQKVQVGLTDYLLNNRKNFINEVHLTDKVKQNALKVGLENITKSALAEL